MIPSPFIVKSAVFVKSAVRPAHYPPPEVPEVAFAGRSNVGKSSLINCLLERKKLVRTSRTPGQTQMINFFLINDAFYFVDLPGYGFARVSQRVRASWRPMMEAYFRKRDSLQGVVLILDARHPPTPDDLQLWNWLVDQGITGIPVLTKIDKISRGKWNSSQKQAAAALGTEADRIVLFSAETGYGREDILSLLLPLLAPKEDQAPAES
jgi:GTP-binding protein